VFESDQLLLMQTLKNLVGNAVKFNRSAVKRVEIGWRQLRENGFIEIFVRDNGIGIDPQFQRQVFGIFQRLHTDREFEGTGIGLAMVQKAAIELGGTVRVESAPGKGSTFYLKIPAKMESSSYDRTTDDRKQGADDRKKRSDDRRSEEGRSVRSWEVEKLGS